MNTEVIRWDEEMKKHAKEVASRERPQVSQISLRSGIMTYQGQAIPGNKLPCIIIASAVERRYDIEAFDPANIKPPACFSLSTTGDTMVPDPSASKVQAEACDSCPQASWQPNPKRPGKNIKPCKERRRIALLPISAVKDGNMKNAEIAIIAIPVTSVKNWALYVNQISAEFQRPPWGMMTEIVVSPHIQNQFEVKFNPIGKVADEALGDLHNKIPQADTILLTPYDSSGYMVPSDAEGALGKSDKARKY